MWELVVSEGGCSRLLIGSFYTVVKNAPKHSLIGSVQWPKTLRDSSLVAKFDEVDLVGFADRSCRLGQVSQGFSFVKTSWTAVFFFFFFFFF